MQFNAKRYTGFLKLMGYPDIPSDIPLSYPIVESFRLPLLAMSHVDFPFNVLGSVLARNSTTVTRAMAPDEKLTYR